MGVVTTCLDRNSRSLSHAIPSYHWGKRRLGRISCEGSERLHQLLVLGAPPAITVAKPGNKHATPWLIGVLARRPRRVAAVALANKMARTVWAMLASGEACRKASAAG